MKKIFVLSAVTLLLFSCKKNDEENKTFKGATVQLHGGKAWSWIRMKDKNVPDQMGIAIDDAALNSVPLGGHDGGNHDHTHSENNLVLPLHPKASVTPFKTIGLEWNPEGHPPANVYTLPHFDFHFYMMSQAEVEAATDMAKLNIDPAPEYLPENHVGGNPVPKMGKHWLDITSPELHPTNPATFTQTFIYGSYDGKVNFYEPMITLNFLKNTQSFERSIPQPARFRQSGYYPTKMKIVKQDGVTNVVLHGFVYRTAS